jgi:hypothetical protein
MIRSSFSASAISSAVNAVSQNTVTVVFPGPVAGNAIVYIADGWRFDPNTFYPSLVLANEAAKK